VLPGELSLAAYQPRLTTEIYSTEVQPNGTWKHELLARVFKEDRDPVDLKDIPDALQRATVAIETGGSSGTMRISPVGIARAAWVNFGAGRDRTGRKYDHAAGGAEHLADAGADV